MAIVVLGNRLYLVEVDKVIHVLDNINVGQQIILAFMATTSSITQSASSAGTYTKTEVPQVISSSFSRSASIGNYIYSLVNTQLYVFHNTNDLKAKMTLKNDNVETIQAANGNLFIGSETGMSIYDCSKPESPKQAGNFEHVQSNDPVVAEGTNAFISTRRANGSGFNELNAVDITNIYSPRPLGRQTLTGPYGLAVNSGSIYMRWQCWPSFIQIPKHIAKQS